VKSKGCKSGEGRKIPIERDGRRKAFLLRGEFIVRCEKKRQKKEQGALGTRK
jgi:hypothetical protein